jgi:hypothetical protein
MPTKMARRAGDHGSSPGESIASRESIAVVGPRRSDARRAAALVARKRPGVRLLPMTLPDYLARCGRPLMRVVLTGFTSGPRSRDAVFVAAARARLLWRRPSPEVYDAISGLLTELPARRRKRSGAPADHGPYLLLEGDVVAARARRVLESPVRHWIVEHVGRVRISDDRLAALAARGVRWSVLWPVRVLSVVSSRKATRARGYTPSPR